MANRIGIVVKERREALGLTQEDLAEKIDKTASFVGQIERGVATPSVETLEKLIDTLAIDAGPMFSNVAIPNEYQDTMILLEKLDIPIRRFIIDSIRMASAQQHKEGKVL